MSAPLAIQLLEQLPTVEKPTAERRRVVIVGAGFAGIAAALSSISKIVSSIGLIAATLRAATP